MNKVDIRLRFRVDKKYPVTERTKKSGPLEREAAFYMFGAKYGARQDNNSACY
jgi:hypothetical protein